MQKHSGGDVGCDTGRLSSVQSLSCVRLFVTHEPQHARPPCPSPTCGACSNWYPSSQWCHPTISSSVIPFFSCPQSFPKSGSFQVSQLFAWGGQNFGVSASTSVLPVNTQDWSPLGWTGWVSLQSKGLSGVFSNTTVWSQAILELGEFGSKCISGANYSSFRNLRLVVVLSWMGPEATTLLGVKKNDTKTLGKVNWSVGQEWHCLTLVFPVWKLRLVPLTSEYAWSRALSSRWQLSRISKQQQGIISNNDKESCTRYTV